jgi:Ca-activated chloride channel family protein
VLSNADRRALYDATLEEAQSKDRAALEIHLEYSRPSLVQLDEAQLLYALLEVRPCDLVDQGSLVPLNLCLVVDRSTSMQGEKLDVAKAAAIQVVRMLRAHDLFGLVVFSDRAESLLPAAYRHDPNKAQSRMQSVQAFGATEMLQGLRAGIDQLRAGLDPGRASHLILLTDGHVWRWGRCLTRRSSCSEYWDQRSQVGTDWNDIFLDALAARTEKQHILPPGTFRTCWWISSPRWRSWWQKTLCSSKHRFPESCSRTAFGFNRRADPLRRAG